MVDYRQQLEELEHLLREACEVANIEFHEPKFAPADLADRIVALEAQGKSLASLVLEQGRSMAHLGRERDYWKAAAEKAAEVSAE